MTLQEAETQVQSLVASLTPKTITYSSVTLVLSLGGKQEEQVECRIYQSKHGMGTHFHETFKASSISRLLGKIEGELRDVYQPENLEPIELLEVA
ncbi:hypothetical protein Q5H92_14965 [Hymenobacter sp. M29]|uniref:Uncharacterized protein n=1 Tax=Hymenobacter mellowenesis TaxID=3063995 RepID=A0ABT9ADP1_9BACT|nr:hypothetical protein [Hymenobacter sp. M29]MDO7847668.1 hypothetical protein [Hymenobacter sp. M29]